MRVHLVVAGLLVLGLPALTPGEDLFEPTVEDEESLTEDYLEGREETLLDLNAASADDLAALPALTRADAGRIVAHRRRRGGFRTPDDLFRVEGLARETAEALLPHVCVKSPAGFSSRLRAVRRTSAAGSSQVQRSSLRSRTAYRLGARASAALITDKDAGESSPFDFSGGYLEVLSTGGSLRTIAGDFRPGFGQGLIFSRWSRTPSDVDRVGAPPSRQVGYGGAEENGAFRGLYAEKAAAGWRMAAFGSSARFDAVRDTAGQVERLVEGGLHVTATERARADALRERALGLRVERTAARRWRAGLSVLGAGFDPPFRRQEGIAGPSNLALGVDGGVVLRGLSVAGEAARVGSARGWVAAATFRPGRLRLGLVARDYDPSFQTLHGGGFSSFGETRNERGVFAGLSWNGQGSRRVTVTFDRSVRPGPTATLPPGAARSSLALTVRHRLPGRVGVRWSGRIRWDQAWKGKDIGVAPRNRQTLRMTAERPLTKGIRLLGNGELVRVGIGSARESGGSAFAGVQLRWKGVRAEGRLTSFRIPSYESRLYEWEGAPAGMMALRTVTGRGLKAYAVVALRTGPCNATCRLWRQRPTDGRNPTTEFVFQMDIKK